MIILISNELIAYLIVFLNISAVLMHPQCVRHPHIFIQDYSEEREEKEQFQREKQQTNTIILRKKNT